MRNARFWVWHNGGWAKLTLRPGQRVEVCSRGPCEEGYSGEAAVWEHCPEEGGGAVLRQLDAWGSDCDGRWSRHSEDCCPIGDLNGYEPTNDCGLDAGEKLPKWGDRYDWQTDESAEAMGY